MPERYKHLEGHLYYDRQEKVIVRNMGDRYVFVRHDRRVRQKSVEDEKRGFERSAGSMKPIEKGLFFDKATMQIYRKTGDRLVLYSKNRRKSSKPVAVERRKAR